MHLGLILGRIGALGVCFEKFLLPVEVDNLGGFCTAALPDHALFTE